MSSSSSNEKKSPTKSTENNDKPLSKTDDNNKKVIVTNENDASNAILFSDADQLDMSDRLVEVLSEIFQRFDVNKDGEWDQTELDAFAIACNGSAFDDATKDEIKQHFNCSPNGDLTQHGFIQLYSLQTSAEPEETWRDLKSLGYDEQLKKIN